jgi:hypothetical protein
MRVQNPVITDCTGPTRPDNGIVGTVGYSTQITLLTELEIQQRRQHFMGVFVLSSEGVQNLEFLSVGSKRQLASKFLALFFHREIGCPKLTVIAVLDYLDHDQILASRI